MSMLKKANLFNCFCCLLASLSFTGLADVFEQQLSPRAVEKALQSRRIFLFIGLNQFADAHFPSLEFPQKDVEDFHQFVRDNNWSDQDREIILTGKDANLAAVLKALDQIEADNLSPQDLVLVYLSTHGTLDFGKNKLLQRFAVLHDTDFKQTHSSGLAIAYLENRLSRLRSQKKALILALCHSGSGKSILPGPIQTELRTMKGELALRPIHEVSSAMMVLSASSWGEPAREDATLKNDVYTHFLLEGLAKSDVNQDGAISLFEAHEYARSTTYDFTRGAQMPSALLNMKGMDPLILKGRITKTGIPLIFADTEGWRNLTLKINGQLKGSLWQPKLAESGNVRVALLDPEQPESPLLDHYIYLQPEESYSVSALLAHKSSWQLHTVIGQLPLDLQAHDHDANHLTSLGIGVDWQEIYSTPLVAKVELQKTSTRSTRTFDYEQSRIDINAELIRLGLGLVHYWTPNLRLENALVWEYLQIKRQIDDTSFFQRTQNLHLVYPSIDTELRYLNFLGPLFGGIGVVLYPVRKSLVQIENKHQALLPVTSRIVFGVTF